MPDTNDSAAWRPETNRDVLDFLATRRSVAAKTLTVPVPERGELETLLEIASRAPDHGKLVPWRFVVIEGDRLADIADAAVGRLAELGADESSREKTRNVYLTGATVVAVVFRPQASPKIPAWEQELAAGAVCTLFLSAALAAGWGANWLTGALARDTPFLTSALGLTEEEWVAGFMHVGTPRIRPAERDRPEVRDITTWL